MSEFDIAFGMQIRHRCFREAAAFGGGPLVVDVGDHPVGQSNGGGFVGEDPDPAAAALDFFVEALERIRTPDLTPVRPGEGAKGEHIRFAHRIWAAALSKRSASMRSTCSHWAAISSGDYLGANVGKGGADRPWRPLGAAALQAHAGEPPTFHGAQELAPEGLVFGGADLDPKVFPGGGLR